MVKTVLYTCLLFCITSAFCQQKLRMADRHFSEFAYTEAAHEYEDYLTNITDPAPEVLAHVADASYFIGKIAAASRWYEKLYTIEGPAMNDLHFRRYVLSLKGEEQYKRADELLWQRLEAKGDEVLKKRFTTQKQHLDSIAEKPDGFSLTNLEINTDKADFGAAFYGDKIVYASGKDSVRDNAKTYSWNQQPYLSLYVAHRDTTSGALLKEKKFLPNAQTNYHNAAAAFSPDLKTVYVSVNNVNRSNSLQNDTKGTNNIQLVQGSIENEHLTKKKVTDFSSAEYSVGQPAVSSDGKWLYFVSDMPGGYGETDIYAAQIFSDGVLGTPVNLGPAINTAGREMFPFVNDDTLYFSSDGHYGLGGLDVFSSKHTAEMQFAEPQNIGMPVNTNRDDFAFIIDKGGKYGYLSSNRAGGRGDDDLYYFKVITQPCGQLITGRVVNKESGQPIQGVTVKAQVNGVGYTDASGADGKYSINIPCGDEVVVEGTKTDFTTGIPNEKNEIELTEYTDLIKKEGDVEKIAINPIYFDFDEYYITPQAAAELDKVTYVMQNFPNVVIKIESHTDSRGDDNYNMRLSDDRAKSTYSYIVSKGIAPARIESVKGYGESQLRNQCSNGVECTPEEHQLNRRSDFIVVRK